MTKSLKPKYSLVLAALEESVNYLPFFESLTSIDDFSADFAEFQDFKITLAVAPAVCKTLKKNAPKTLKALKSLLKRDSSKDSSIVEIEILATAATPKACLTHYIDIPKALDVQIKTGLQSVEYYFGKKAHGFFLPHYAPGIEKPLLAHGVEWAVTDAKTILFSKPVPQNGIFSPVLCKDSDLLLFAGENTAFTADSKKMPNVSALVKKQLARLGKAARLIRQESASSICVFDASLFDSQQLHAVAEQSAESERITFAHTRTIAKSSDFTKMAHVQPYFSYCKENVQLALDKKNCQLLRKEREAVMCMIDMGSRYKNEKERANRRVLTLLAKEAILAMSNSGAWGKDAFFKLHEHLCSNALNPTLLVAAEKKYENDFPWLSYTIFAS